MAVAIKYCTDLSGFLLLDRIIEMRLSDKRGLLRCVIVLRLSKRNAGASVISY